MVNIRFIHCICLDTSGSVLEVTAPLENQISNIKSDDRYDTMDIMKYTIRNEVIIGKFPDFLTQKITAFEGNAHLLDLEVLVPDRPARLLAMGNLARNRAPASDNPKVESLSAINYLVVGAGGDIYQMMEAVSRIKEKNPTLKVNYLNPY